MAKAPDDLCDVRVPAMLSDAAGPAEPAPHGTADGAARGRGSVFHCFVDPTELQRILMLMVAAELAGAAITAALSV